MVSWIIAYLSTALVFFGLDYIWLTRVALDFYRSRIGDIMRDQPNLTAAGLFYLFYIAAIVYFAVLPALQSQNFWLAVLNGAFLGLVAYGTYDMTNLATLKAWTLSLSLVDMAWGTAVSATAAGAAYLVTSRFLG